MKVAILLFSACVAVWTFLALRMTYEWSGHRLHSYGPVLTLFPVTLLLLELSRKRSSPSAGPRVRPGVWITAIILAPYLLTCNTIAERQDLILSEVSGLVSTKDRGGHGLPSLTVENSDGRAITFYPVTKLAWDAASKGQNFSKDRGSRNARLGDTVRPLIRQSRLDLIRAATDP